MGLKDDLMEAKAQAALASGANPDDIDISEGSATEVEAELMKEAIVNFLTESEFRITKLNAPVRVENFKIPEQLVNIELETLLGPYQPVLKILKQLGSPLGLGPAIDKLEGEIEQAIIPLLEGGAKLAGLELGKDVGGLESTGYVFIGEDPDSEDGFDVEDEDGQRDYTSAKLIRKDIENLL